MPKKIQGAASGSTNPTNPTNRKKTGKNSAAKPADQESLTAASRSSGVSYSTRALGSGAKHTTSRGKQPPVLIFNKIRPDLTPEIPSLPDKTDKELHELLDYANANIYGSELHFKLPQVSAAATAVSLTAFCASNQLAEDNEYAKLAKNVAVGLGAASLLMSMVTGIALTARKTNPTLERKYNEFLEQNIKLRNAVSAEIEDRKNRLSQVAASATQTHTLTSY